jgi:hypothetical protein
MESCAAARVAIKMKKTFKNRHFSFLTMLCMDKDSANVVRFILVVGFLMSCVGERF